MLENVKVAQIKKNKKNKVHLFSNFASGRTLPTTVRNFWPPCGNSPTVQRNCSYTWQLHYTLGPSLAKQSMFGMFDISNIIRLRRVSDEILQPILCHMDHS